ncbi:MAG TPA: LysR substrate-binding domain-containing protein [Acetobacteraceae bacterium]|jgi:DNA-binding transcriptional LysR family regulator|nr:LysR substrate-binding domain-containing protein [Acetobacteraceae bacterium]
MAAANSQYGKIVAHERFPSSEASDVKKPSWLPELAVSARDIDPSSVSLDPLASSFSTSYAGVVAFVVVAAEGSFAKAGDRLGIGRSAVSRNVRKLEIQLGTRLFLRTTRSTSLTREGERFYEKCQPGVERIVQALEDMRDLREGPPRGQLRIVATPAFGRSMVMPLLGGFRARYPDIAIELLLDERHVDFTCDRIDVAFHDGRMEDSQVVARQVIPMQLLVCASPAYARAHGLPPRVEDIAGHRCIRQRLVSGRIAEWEFKVDGRACKLMPESTCAFNDAELVLRAVLDGQGIAQLPGFLAAAHVHDGRLVTCLGQHQPDDRGHYVCYLSRHQLPTRIRVFIDYMTERIRESDRQGLTLLTAAEHSLHMAAGHAPAARKTDADIRFLDGRKGDVARQATE